jgi:hypothetical protein
MKLEDAEKLDSGDIVYDPFGCPVVISSWVRHFNDIDGLYFGTISTDLKLTTYHYKELELIDEEMLCDEHKSYLAWIREEKKPFTFETKEAYIQGYAAGFSAKRQRNSEEQLQK